MQERPSIERPLAERLQVEDLAARLAEARVQATKRAGLSEEIKSLREHVKLLEAKVKAQEIAKLNAIDLDSIRAEVQDQCNRITGNWGTPPEVKRKQLKNLMRKYHPDKHKIMPKIFAEISKVINKAATDCGPVPTHYYC